MIILFLFLVYNLYLAPKFFTMFYYNITFHIEKNVFEQWLQWQKTHIAEMLSVMKFQSAKLIKVENSDQSSETYCIQYQSDNRSVISNFEENHLAAFRHSLYLKFGENVLPFSTILEIIQEYKC